MKSFKGSSNRLGPLGFQSEVDVELPFPMAHSVQAIHIRTEAALYPTRQAPLVP
jgi:hypothetical protein